MSIGVGFFVVLFAAVQAFTLQAAWPRFPDPEPNPYVTPYLEMYSEDSGSAAGRSSGRRRAQHDRSVHARAASSDVVRF